MKSLPLLALRLTVGGYVAAHGAQKLFGSFGGSGLDATSNTFERIGITPGRPMATVAGAAELGGGVLTAAGIAHPLGPLTVSGVMAVATSTHLEKGPFASKGGFELPLTNLAAALALAMAGPGKLRLGPALSKKLTALVLVVTAALAAFSISKVLGERQAEVPAAREG